MKFEVSLSDFLKKNRISSPIWDQADVSWNLLASIAEDYLDRQSELAMTAELCARVMQKLPAVHSVRWRVKDVEHLLEKIVRKRATAGNGSKYLAISVDNYYEVVTDLVGLRALHLFKDDCFEIDVAFRDAFMLLEGEVPVAYIRQGDPPELLDRFDAAGFKVEEHAAGYRSVHYVVATRPLQQRFAVEVQVRTIFEEGWSEIDHRIRYPNFSHDPQVVYFLRIFNRLAGSADEMGSFVRGLVTVLEVNQQQVAEANENYEQTLRKLEDTVAELDEVRQVSASADATVSRLKKELSELRTASTQAAIVRAQYEEVLKPSSFADLGFQGAAGVSPAADLLKRAGIGSIAADMAKQFGIGQSAAELARQFGAGRSAAEMAKQFGIGQSPAELARQLGIGHSAAELARQAGFARDTREILRQVELSRDATEILKQADLGLAAAERLKRTDLR